MEGVTTGKSSKLLPENAYRKLREGEEYKPIVPAGDRRAEVTPWSIGLGIVMVVVFTAAAAYISLRAGNGIEASIPIAILAIFFGMVRKVKSTILENVMVQSVGQASGVVAAGATFVVPALYINRLDAEWWHIFLACTVGGFLGVVLIIPLRKYFVKDQHGDLPFPEATAINEVLVTGESAGGGAGKILIMAFLLGAAFDFLIEGCHLWNSDISTQVLPWGFGEYLSGLRIEVQILGIAALFGLGYIIGMKYASIIAAGSVLAFVIMVPIVYAFGKEMGTFAYAGKTFDLSVMGSGAIFANFIKPIGIGAIAISGLIGILRMWRIVAGSLSLGFKGLSKKGRASQAAVERTQLDMEPRTVLLIQLLSTLGMGAVFFVVALLTKSPDGGGYGLGAALLFALVGMFSGFLLSFLFTPVAAQAIAIVGVNPVSGMTLITVVMAIGALILVGLKGTAGMIIALIVGTAVCTALSTSGALISDFKVGYWIGSTPRNQQRWKFLGIVVAALIVALVIPLMDSAYQFLITDPTTGGLVPNDKVLPAPQGNMIAAVSKGLMADPANQPWLLYALGGLVAVLLLMAGVPMLAFALGMYLPIGINMAVLAGAICAHLVSRSGKTAEEKAARKSQGPLIASGLMAGAALFGILTAVLRLPGLGAPVQHISVGMDYRLEAVVEGSVVKKGGLVIASCEEARSACKAPGACSVEVKDEHKCNELLKTIAYEEDENGCPKPDKDALVGAHAVLTGIAEKASGLYAPDVMSREIRTKLVEAANGLAGKVAARRDGTETCAPVVGAGDLVSASVAAGRLVKVRHEKARADATKAEETAADASRLAEKLGTAEAKEKAEAAKKAAEEAIQAAKKPAEDRATVAAIVHDAGKLNRELHPKLRNAWYGGGVGRGLGFLMLVVLGLGCYMLAKVGARWQMEHDARQEAAEAAREAGKHSG